MAAFEAALLRLSPNVMQAFKAAGKGWQSRIDAAVEAENAQIANVRPNLLATMAGGVPLPHGHSACRHPRDDEADRLKRKWITRSNSSFGPVVQIPGPT